MLALLVPGVLMGGSSDTAPGGGDTHLLMLMGVGRSWWPLFVILGSSYA
jgi:hypothetical protein